MTKLLTTIDKFQNKAMELDTVKLVMSEIKDFSLDEKIEFLVMLQFAAHGRFWESVKEKETMRLIERINPAEFE